MWPSMIFPGMRVDTISQRILVLVDSMVLFTCDTRMHWRNSRLQNLETSSLSRKRTEKEMLGTDMHWPVRT